MSTRPRKQTVQLLDVDVRNADQIAARLEHLIGSSANIVTATRYALARTAKMMELRLEGDDDE